MVEFELPAGYDYHSSLSFVYTDPEPTPELWDRKKCLFLFPVEGELIAIYFRKDGAIIDTRMSREEAEEYVKLKLNLDSYGIRAMGDGLQVARELGLLGRYPHIEGFIPPRLGDPPRWMYSGLIKTIILQMVSYKVARRMMARFVKAFGKPIKYGDMATFTFPEPEMICEAPGESIKKEATVSKTKARAIKEVARLELEGRLKEIEDLAWEDPHRAAEELVKIEGIGRWTAYVSMMAGTGIWHAQPVDRLLITLEKLGVKCDPSIFRERQHAAGYISVAILFGEEALRGRYFKLQNEGCENAAEPR